MTKALLTAAGARMAELLELGRPGLERFADEHGYEVLVDRSLDDSSHDGERRARWRKLELLRGALASHHLVVWLDADAMICRFDRDLEADLPPDRFQGLVLEAFPDRVNPNTGVWAMRSEPASLALLDRLESIGPLPHSWTDQATLCAALGWDLGDHHGAGARPRHPSPFLAGTAWLPPEWNDVSARGAPAARIRHFAGMAIDDRVRAMTRTLRQLQRDRAV